jgi:4-amino-4-deoxy-L-arabinose transferase-like glycosyltransferase
VNSEPAGIPVRRELALVAVACALLFLVPAPWRALWSPDEGRYAEIAREMVVSGDWVTPRLDGLKYFEKPPLVYWMTAGVWALAGAREGALRAVPALAAVGGCLAVWAAARRRWGARAGRLAALVLATSPYWFALAQTLSLDMPVSALLTAGLAAFLIALTRESGARRRWLLAAAYLAFGLATLAKGLMGIVLPGLVIVPWLAWTGRWRRPLELTPFTGLAIVLAVAAPWHLLVAARNPDFAWFYFVHEHFQRFTTDVHRRVEPVWYFVPILVGGMLPWSAALPGALGRAWRSARRERDEVDAFLLLWAVLIFVFFSASHSKLAPYVLPVAPPLALLAARWLDQRPALGRVAAAVAAAAGLLVLTLAVVPRLARPGSNTALAVADFGAWRWAVAAAALVVGGVAWFWRARPRAWPRAVALATTLFLLVLAWAAPRLDDHRSVKSLALALAPRLAPGDEVVTYRCYPQDLPVYLDRQVEIAGYLGELEFGARAEDHHARIYDGGEFFRRWNGGRRIYVVSRAETWDEVQAGSVRPPLVLGRTPEYVLAVNRD